MRRSTKTAILASLAISTAVGVIFAMLQPGGDGASATRINGLEQQIAALSAENRRLSDAVDDIQKRMQAGADITVAAPAAPPTPATTAEDDAEARRLIQAATQAAATAEALEARFDEQRRRLFIQTPQCKKPNAEGLIICAVTMRNNAEQSLLVSFSQSGSRAVLTPDVSFSSIRMRSQGQTRFSYTATSTIPALGSRVLEIAFGPAEAGPVVAQTIALSVNKMTYEFAEVALND